MAGYHNAPIQRGELGELSKLQEELDELADAAAQGCKLLELVELADLVGAVKVYLERHHPGFEIGDLLQMALLTERAFKDGSR